MRGKGKGCSTFAEASASIHFETIFRPHAGTGEDSVERETAADQQALDARC